QRSTHKPSSGVLALAHPVSVYPPDLLSALIHFTPRPLSATASCSGEIISAASTAPVVSPGAIWPNGMDLRLTSASVRPPASSTLISSEVRMAQRYATAVLRPLRSDVSLSVALSAARIIR